MQGMESFCVRAFAEAMEVVPYTLAENAGLNPIQIVTELRNRHAAGEKYAGINVRKGSITNMLEENIVQPLLVTSSALTLACECVRMILKVRPSWPSRRWRTGATKCIVLGAVVSVHLGADGWSPVPMQIDDIVPCK